jgi:uncharacterized protein with GYD domain
MPKYLIEASYTLDGIRGVMKEGGSARRDAATKAIEGLGGSVESFHFGFGDRDAYVVADIPDNVSAAAVAIAVNAGGGVQAKTTVLLTPEEVDQATQKTVDYTPPGG